MFSHTVTHTHTHTVALTHSPIYSPIHTHTTLYTVHARLPFSSLFPLSLPSLSPLYSLPLSPRLLYVPSTYKGDPHTAYKPINTDINLLTYKEIPTPNLLKSSPAKYDFFVFFPSFDTELARRPWMVCPPPPTVARRARSSTRSTVITSPKGLHMNAQHVTQQWRPVVEEKDTELL